MKKIALLASLLLPLAACDKQKPDSAASGSAAGAASGYTAPAKPPVDGQIVMIAKVAEIPGAFPANDLYNYCYVMKYQVVKVLQGAYADPDILVGHYNPRIARDQVKDEQDSKVGGNVKSFAVGDVHYLVLSPVDGLWTGSMEDDFFKDKRPRWWALWADNAK